jgi:hypothetical protein
MGVNHFLRNFIVVLVKELDSSGFIDKVSQEHKVK